MKTKIYGTTNELPEKNLCFVNWKSPDLWIFIFHLTEKRIHDERYSITY
jgi:hypothetical protein